MVYLDRLSDYGWAGSSAVTPPKSVQSKGSHIAAFAGYRSDWQRIAERRLSHVIRLEYGWDGYQGRPVDPTVAEYAFQLLERLLLRPGLPLPEITPLSYGGLVLEWHRKGWDVEIEIEAPGRHRIYTHQISSGEEEEIFLGVRLEPLKVIVGKVCD